MKARSTEFCRVHGVELPVSTATLHPDWSPILELHAESVRVLLPERLVPVVEAFLTRKKRVGDEASRQFFAQFETVADYVPRLIEKRPAAFFGERWTVRLRDGTTIDDARRVYANGDTPGPLADYMTLEEAQIAALLVVSSPAIWRVDDGAKIVQGVAVGITPPTLDEPNNLCVADAASMKGGVYECRIRSAIETFFLDCVARSKAVARAACAILDSRVFVDPADPDREKKEQHIVDAIVSVLDANVFEEISLLQLVNFTAAAHKRWYAKATLDGEEGAAAPLLLAQTIEFISSESKEVDSWKAFFEGAVAAADKVQFEREYFRTVVVAHTGVETAPADLLPCVAYAWDANALPGNRLWVGQAAAIGVANSNIAEVQNPYINADRTLRTLIVQAGPTATEATRAKLRLTRARYRQKVGELKIASSRSRPSVVDPDFIVHTEGFGERDMCRAWGSMAFGDRGSEEEWTGVQALYDAYSQKHFIMASSMSTTASGIPEYTHLLERQLKEMTLPYLRPGWGLKVVTTKVSATDAISACLPEVARIATMVRTGTQRVSPKMASVGTLFGGFMGPLTGASAFDNIKANAIGNKRELKHFPMNQTGNFFVHSLDEALAEEVPKGLGAALKTVLDELFADKDVGLLVIEPIAAHATPEIVFWRKPLLKQLVEHCAKHNILVLVDETLTGFCATGALFAFVHYGIVPDLILVGKRLGLAALIAVHGRHDWFTDITCMGFNGVLGLTTSTGDLFAVLRSVAFLKRLMPIEATNKRITDLGKAALPIFTELVSAKAKGIGIFITLPKPLTRYLGVTRCLNRRFILPYDLDPSRLRHLFDPSRPQEHFGFCAICAKLDQGLTPCEWCPSSFHEACRARDANAHRTRCHECAS